nr:MogA/MoaB family molybdenum cofactor biosynthesis protein [uncultured Olsenella sp.]
MAGSPGLDYQAAVVTVSDRCSRGEREDASGPALVGLLEGAGYDVVASEVVPDEQAQIEHVLRSLVARDVALVVTTGGTGFSPRDVTPEATVAVCERMAPGIPEAMRAASMEITSHGCLSREACGICGGSLVVNLPGSPKAACENLSAVIGPIAHGLRMLRGGQADCAAGK